MVEFYRFRSIDALLDKYQELEKRTIYFADPEELNDPMEGFRDIVWNGDKIVWTKFIKHYVFCLHRSYLLLAMVRNSTKLDVDSIPILDRWDQLTIPLEKDLFDGIWNNFHNLLNIKEIIEALARPERKIRYREIGYYLQGIHFVLLGEIQKSHIEHGLMSELQIPKLSYELSTAASMENLLNLIELTEAVEDEEQLNAIFHVCGDRYDDIRLELLYNSRTIHTGILAKNTQLVTVDFPKVYVEQLERLLWSKWYTACFTKSYHNSSVWGHYGDNHKGACLIFEAIETDNSNQLGLNLTTDSGTRTLFFHEVNYAEKPCEIDFFRTICREMTVDMLMKQWYTDHEGNTSKCAAHIESQGGDEDVWKKRYWEDVFRDITTKTTDWAYEQECRLILEDGLSQFNEKKERTLIYDFNSLKGIIFGIKTSTEDQMKIINIIEKKWGKNKRTDFKYYQAYYCPIKRKIRKRQIYLPFSNVKDTDQAVSTSNQ